MAEALLTVLGLGSPRQHHGQPFLPPILYKGTASPASCACSWDEHGPSLGNPDPPALEGRSQEVLCLQHKDFTFQLCFGRFQFRPCRQML